jgi:hypothetical protein
MSETTRISLKEELELERRMSFVYDSYGCLGNDDVSKYTPHYSSNPLTDAATHGDEDAGIDLDSPTESPHPAKGYFDNVRASLDVKAGNFPGAPEDFEGLVDQFIGVANSTSDILSTYQLHDTTSHRMQDLQGCVDGATQGISPLNTDVEADVTDMHRTDQILSRRSSVSSPSAFKRQPRRRDTRFDIPEEQIGSDEQNASPTEVYPQPAPRIPLRYSSWPGKPVSNGASNQPDLDYRRPHRESTAPSPWVAAPAAGSDGDVERTESVPWTPNGGKYTSPDADAQSLALFTKRHRSSKHQPIARRWSNPRKRFTAAMACLTTFMIGFEIGTYVRALQRLQYETNSPRLAWFPRFSTSSPT